MSENQPVEKLSCPNEHCEKFLNDDLSTVYRLGRCLRKGGMQQLYGCTVCGTRYTEKQRATRLAKIEKKQESFL